MDKELFETKIEPLGEVTFKPKSKRTQDSTSDMPDSYVWQAFPIEKKCEDCSKMVVGRTVNIIIKENRDGSMKWLNRCNICLLRTPTKLPFRSK